MENLKTSCKTKKIQNDTKIISLDFAKNMFSFKKKGKTISLYFKFTIAAFATSYRSKKKKKKSVANEYIFFQNKMKLMQKL